MRERLWLTGILVFMGLSWGLTQPFIKIAVSGGYRNFGLIFWQEVIAAAVLGVILALRRRPLPLGRRQIAFYAAIAALGMVLPNLASYEAVRHLPAGVLSVVLAAMPMFAFPIALIIGLERFSALRLAGLLCGLVGVYLLTGPEGGMRGVPVLWLMVALLTPFFYGLEGNFVARFGTGGAGPMQLLCGASLIGVVVTGPLAWLTGNWIDPRPPWGAPDYALIASAMINSLIYALYIWMVRRAGPVFAGQVSYLVTGFGVAWAMIILHEQYSAYFWLALALMLAGLFLVQPRQQAAVEEAAE
jgi:drug/metabolite transporter (DMT)-like permease